MRRTQAQQQELARTKAGNGNPPPSDPSYCIWKTKLEKEKKKGIIQCQNNANMFSKTVHILFGSK